MAMTSAQRSAFEAASGDTILGHHHLWVGGLFMILFLWAAWSLLTAYKGWVDGSVTAKALGGASFRLLLMILLAMAFFLRF
ncbi:MAG: TIGR03758 family integrating conjugative element protein [Burkholderiales bacterium]|jgi:integrating conjugative element protein (TIGR03758 family)|nr:TIGR03758 family integrating conjugative element protein [Burkholderiales bacterium]